MENPSVMTLIVTLFLASDEQIENILDYVQKNEGYSEETRNAIVSFIKDIRSGLRKKVNKKIKKKIIGQDK